MVATDDMGFWPPNPGDLCKLRFGGISLSHPAVYLGKTALSNIDRPWVLGKQSTRDVTDVFVFYHPEDDHYVVRDHLSKHVALPELTIVSRFQETEG